uniref:ARAD1D24640p n=1 Tax=Blastobotrys adeninivorans TaxID=409370 RepID=A0A060TA64_BLAAD
MPGFTAVNAKRPPTSSYREAPSTGPALSTAGSAAQAQRLQSGGSDGSIARGNWTSAESIPEEKRGLKSLSKPLPEPESISNSITLENGTSILTTNAPEVSHHIYPCAYPQQRSRANPPLVMGTVKWPKSEFEPESNEPRLFGVETAPTYRPSQEEFVDPVRFIESIAPEAKKYGVAKIIPPPTYTHPFVLDTEMFWFKTRRQNLNMKDGGDAARNDFVDSLYYFHRHTSKTPINKVPSIDKRPLDLFQFHQCVQLRGGFTEVCKKKLWAQIGRELGYSGKTMTSLSTSLKTAYQKIIYPYDVYVENQGGGSFNSNGTQLPIYTAPSSSPSDSTSVPAKREFDEDEQKHEKRKKLDNGTYISLSATDVINSDGTSAALYPHISQGTAPLRRLEPYSEVASVPEDPMIPPFDNWHRGMETIEDPRYKFKEAPSYNLRQFQQKAELFLTTYFRTRRGDQGSTAAPTAREIESEYWRIITNPSEGVEVEYGADVHTSVIQSGFPQIEKDQRDVQEAIHPWNANVLPFHPMSFFRHAGTEIPYLTKPWIYIGMIFSGLNWHFDDFFTYSVNYLHFGEQKTWYAIPEEDAPKYRELISEILGPDRIKKSPKDLLEAEYMLTPETLRSAGIRCYGLDQRPGEIVITFPKSYHAHFNHGFNLAESVNLAPYFDWLKYGEECLALYNEHRIAPPFSIQQLVVDVATKHGTEFPNGAIDGALNKVRTEELELRKSIRSKRTGIQQKVETNVVPERCYYTNDLCYLSRVVDGDGRIIASSYFLNSSDFDSNDDDYSNYVLICKKSDAELESLETNCEVDFSPKNWSANLAGTLLTETKPSISELARAVNEGEKLDMSYKPFLTFITYMSGVIKWTEQVKKLLSGPESGESEVFSPEAVQGLLSQLPLLLVSSREVDKFIELIGRVNDYISRARSVEASLGPEDRAVGTELVKVIKSLLEESKSINIKLPETERLQLILQRMEWHEQAAKYYTPNSTVSMEDLNALISKGQKVGIPFNDSLMNALSFRRVLGGQFEARVWQAFCGETVDPELLIELHSEIKWFPVGELVSKLVNDALAEYKILSQEMAELQQVAASATSLRERPKYKVAKALVERCWAAKTRPDVLWLEQNQRRVEDWMRKGKKMFGKGNVPFHILSNHISAVVKRNEACFSLTDTFDSADRKHCLCRQSINNATWTIFECEVCHEKYHGKCLKLPRPHQGPGSSEGGSGPAASATSPANKRQTVTIVCPICDWRVGISRDANSLPLSQLEGWIGEAETLFLCPEEMDDLYTIRDQARAMKAFLQEKVLSADSNPSVEQLRFYLTKLEGAYIFLDDEVNYIRQRLHALAPTSSEAPPAETGARQTKSKSGLMANAVDSPHTDNHISASFSSDNSTPAPQAHDAHASIQSHAIQAGHTPSTQATQSPPGSRNSTPGPAHSPVTLPPISRLHDMSRPNQ